MKALYDIRISIYKVPVTYLNNSFGRPWRIFKKNTHNVTLTTTRES